LKSFANLEGCAEICLKNYFLAEKFSIASLWMRNLLASMIFRMSVSIGHQLLKFNSFALFKDNKELT